GATVLLDGAQSVPHAATNVRASGEDFLAFSAHKMLGPTGIGVLYGRREQLDRMAPFLFGGEMIGRVTNEGATWNDLPWKFEAGTPVIAEAVGLHAACDYLDRLGMDAIHAIEMEGIHAHDLASLLNDQGVAVRAGHHCAQPLMESLGIASTVRASFYVYNTLEEVDALVAALEHARKVFQL